MLSWTHGRTARRLGAPAFFAALALWLLTAPAFATTTETTVAEGGAASGEDAALLQAGFEAYTATCSGCHQAGGVGLEGTFPPLVDNPNLTDANYIVETIRNGKQGEITVNGVTYNGVMPSFSALPDDEVEAIVAYIQSGFQVPAAGGETATTLPLVTGSLPELSGMAIVAAFALAAAAIAFVMAPRVIDVSDRISMPWLDAWLRVAIIVAFFVAAIAIVPSMVLQSETVASLPRPVQEVIALGLWGGGLSAGLWGLWYAHREGRI
jgi:mono/diheme cytochrome c family protein